MKARGVALTAHEKKILAEEMERRTIEGVLKCMYILCVAFNDALGIVPEGMMSIYQERR